MSGVRIRPKALHSWRLSPGEAVALQNRLRERIIDCPISPWPKLVAGADIAYDKATDRLFAAVIVVELPGLETVDQAYVVRRSRYPYVPGLLSFREGPALLAAFSRLHRRPDAVIFDGQGRAHPRGFGLAAHLGLWLDLPTVGCAKSLLCGHVVELGPAPGQTAPIELHGRVVGAAVRTRRGVKPVYVSAGYMSNLEDAVRLVLSCAAGYRLPEPTRRAHALVNTLRAKRAR